MRRKAVELPSLLPGVCLFCLRGPWFTRPTFAASRLASPRHVNASGIGPFRSNANAKAPPMPMMGSGRTNSNSMAHKVMVSVSSDMLLAHRKNSDVPVVAAVDQEFSSILSIVPNGRGGV